MNPDLKDRVLKRYQEWAPLRAPFEVANAGTARRDQHSLSEDVMTMSQYIDIGAPTQVTSHRPVIGPLIAGTKRLAMRLAQPLIHVLLSRQIIFNDYTFVIAQRVVFLEGRLRELEEKLAALEKKST